jgi:hypothetical protein
MNKSKKLSKKSVKVIAIILAVIAFIMASLFVVDSFAPANPKVYHKFVLSTFSGSFDGEDTPNSYYQVEIQKNSQSGEKQYFCLNTKVSTTNTVNIKEIWINFSDVYEDDINIFTSMGRNGKSKYLSERTYTKSQIRRDKDGWFRIYNTGKKEGLKVQQSEFYGQLRVGFSANVKVREIVVVDVNGKVGKVAVDHCSNGGKPVVDGYSEVHDGELNPIGVSNVCDESSTFKVD